MSEGRKSEQLQIMCGVNFRLGVFANIRWASVFGDDDNPDGEGGVGCTVHPMQPDAQALSEWMSVFDDNGPPPPDDIAGDV